MPTLPGCADGTSGMIPQAWMERLFSRLAASYGNRLSNMWGDCPQADIIDAWRTGLEGFTGEQIKAGLTKMLDAHPDWPPTLGQFRALCRPPVTAAAHRLYLVDKCPREPIDPRVKAGIDSLISKIRLTP